MMKMLLWCPLLTLLGAGCVTGDGREKPFSPRWTDQTKDEWAFERRKARLKGDEGIGLGGKGKDSKAAVKMDEKGKPRLNIGGDTGLSADLNYSGGPEAKVKYKVKWDFAKPDRKKKRGE